MKKDKIIIGIHGLGNKPPAILLEEWWRLAITEGLTEITGYPKFDFEMVYWADILNDRPLDPDETDSDSDYFIKEKYIPASNIHAQSQEDSMIQKISDKFNDLIFNKKLHENFPSVTDWVIKNFFSELDIYLNGKPFLDETSELAAKDVIKNRLETILKQHKNKKILLIAHSMGSIIAFDVLSENKSGITINTFVTIGSPLGVPFIIEKIKNTKTGKLKTPDSITNAWFNFADPDDKLAVNYELEKIFEPNKKGIRPQGQPVKNNYEMNGDPNPHKSFGYLRTPELAFAINQFMQPEKGKLEKWIREKVNYIKTLFGKK